MTPLSVLLADPGFTFSISGFINLAVTCVLFYFGARKYGMDRMKDERDRQKVREDTVERDTTRHVENKTKMDMIIEFQRDQLLLNQRVTEQMQQFREQTAELKTQTALLQIQTKDITDKLWHMTRGQGDRRGETT